MSQPTPEFVHVRTWTTTVHRFSVHVPGSDVTFVDVEHSPDADGPNVTLYPPQPRQRFQPPWVAPIIEASLALYRKEN